MEAQFASLTSDGLLALPADAQNKLGLHPGSRLAISLEGDRIILQPVESDELDQLCGILETANKLRVDPPSDTPELLREKNEREARARVEEIGNTLRSLFAGQPSLEDEYFRTRDVDKW